MDDVLRLESKPDDQTHTSASEEVLLVEEFLKRISQHCCNNICKENNSDISEKKGLKDTYNDNKHDSIEKPTEKIKKYSFKGFPQFERRISAEAQRILAYKYLKANNNNLESSINMAIDTNEFRRQHKLDSIMLFPSLIPIRGFTDEEICKLLHLPKADIDINKENEKNSKHFLCFSEYLNNHHILRPIIDLISSYYPSSIHYFDKKGHPVMYGRLGSIKPKTLYSELRRISPLRQRPENLAMIFHLYSNELLGRIVEYCSFKKVPDETINKSSEKITTATVIIDCEGVRMRKFINGPFKGIFNELLKLDQRYYPEILHQLLLVNCPSSMTFLNGFFNFFDHSKDGLRRKVICVKKKKTLKVLKEIIDIDKIPDFLGGNCHCDGGCVPFNTTTPKSIHSNNSNKSFDNNTDTSINNNSSSSSSSSSTSSKHGGSSSGSTQMTHTSTITPINSINFTKLQTQPQFVKDEEEQNETSETQNVLLPPRRKHTITCCVGVEEEVTWEFVVKRGKVGFTAVFIECSASGHTSVLMPPTRVTEAADHFVPTTPGALILTWDNTHSLFTGRKLQARVLCHSLRYLSKVTSGSGRNEGSEDCSHRTEKRRSDLIKQ